MLGRKGHKGGRRHPAFRCAQSGVSLGIAEALAGDSVSLRSTGPVHPLARVPYRPGLTSRWGSWWPGSAPRSLALTQGAQAAPWRRMRQSWRLAGARLRLWSGLGRGETAGVSTVSTGRRRLDCVSIPTPIFTARGRPLEGSTEGDSRRRDEPPAGRWFTPSRPRFPAPSAASVSAVLTCRRGGLLATPRRPPRGHGREPVAPRLRHGSGRWPRNHGRLSKWSWQASVSGPHSPTAQRLIPVSTQIFKVLLALILGCLIQGHSPLIETVEVALWWSANNARNNAWNTLESPRTGQQPQAARRRGRTLIPPCLNRAYTQLP